MRWPRLDKVNLKVDRASPPLTTPKNPGIRINKIYIHKAPCILAPSLSKTVWPTLLLSFPPGGERKRLVWKFRLSWQLTSWGGVGWWTGGEGGGRWLTVCVASLPCYSMEMTLPPPPPQGGTRSCKLWGNKFCKRSLVAKLQIELGTAAGEI